MRNDGKPGKTEDAMLRSELEKKNAELRERIKELNCLLAIARYPSRHGDSLDALFAKIIGNLIAAVQYPRRAYARIMYRDIDTKSGNYAETRYAVKKKIMITDKEEMRFELGYLKPTGGKLFLKEELRLFGAVCDLAKDIVAMKISEVAVKKASRKLMEKSDEVERKTIALREILSNIEKEKADANALVVANINTLVLPYLQKLKTSGLYDKRAAEYIEIMEANLRNITKPLIAPERKEKRTTLTPKETEICGLIRNGYQNKEIAEMLHISILTVERHRFNIRKKLGMRNSKANLQTYLQS